MGNTIQELKAQIEDANNKMLDIQTKFIQLQQQGDLDYPLLHKVFLLGAYHATCATERYIKSETYDLEHEIDVYTSGNDYLTVQGNITINSEDISEHINTPAKGDENNHADQMCDLLGFAKADIDILIEKLTKSTIDLTKSTDEKA